MQKPLLSAARGTHACTAQGSSHGGAGLSPGRRSSSCRQGAPRARSGAAAEPGSAGEPHGSHCAGPAAPIPPLPAPALVSSVGTHEAITRGTPLRTEELLRSRCRTLYATSHVPWQRFTRLLTRLPHSLQQSTNCQHFVCLSSCTRALV